MGVIKLDHVLKKNKGDIEKNGVLSDETPVKNDQDQESESGTSTDDYERGVWARKLEFIFSVIGYSVGVGNIWRFPYLVMQNGGGAFLIPYFIFLFFCGVPLFFLELCLGQFSGTSSLFVWKICPLFKGLGYLMIVVSFVYCWYYIMVLVWVLVYLFNSFMPELPWEKCGHEWNTPNCRGINAHHGNIDLGNCTDFCPFSDNVTSVPSPIPGLNLSMAFTVTPSKEFWQLGVLQKSSGLEEFGMIRWHLAVALVVAWVLIFLCLMKGIKSSGKVVYVTALLPYVLLTVFLVRGVTLPGALDGILFYITPKFDKLLDFQVWLEAGIQVFYSLGPAWGGLITMASYNKFHNNCLRDSIICTAADGFTSFYGGFVIFSVIGFMAKEAGKSVEEIATSGPGLALVVYPEAITKLPVSHLWAVLFFIMLLSLGIDSQFGVFETMSSGITDAFPKLRKKKIFLTAALCFVICILDLPFTAAGGIYLYQLVDWYFAAFCVLLTSFLECFIVGWMYGADRFSRDIQMMLGHPPPTYMRICWCFITPVIMLTTFLLTLFQYAPPTYDGYTYSSSARVMGFILACIPIIPIPVCMIWEIIHAKGTLIERLKFLIKPAADWGPRVKKYKDTYSLEDSQEMTSFLDTVKQNLLGTSKHDHL
ncbi:hypothetical protein CHS0354_009382 [Potamilus streckersoni]|uniref:Transporter n=1 Tax=Potamilus streckersoni TaxID=2493646 RepID=A0AAE0T411_9BIVA|nr:hypothetical protein CHS0354_009382 [Potamilus streckersoni]